MGERIYLDTNQLYFIRRIAKESQGWEYGDYSWAYRYFKNDPAMIADIRALCYIVALQYEWDLEFCASGASYMELCQSLGSRALSAKETWELFVSIQTDESSKWLSQTVDSLRQAQLFDLNSILDGLEFFADIADREIVRDFVRKDADVLLTSDGDILKHEARLAGMGLRARRPAEWINDFLKDARGKEDAVDWVERILFRVG
jgi:hypothetical protein